MYPHPYPEELLLSNVIGDRLRQELQRTGYNAVTLAKKCGLRSSFIYDILHGKSLHPSGIKLSLIADALGVTVDYLVGKKDAPSPATQGEGYIAISSMLVDASMGKGRVITVEREGEPYFFRRSWIRERLQSDPANLRMLFVRDDSMEPTLCHNDMILVDVTRTSPTPPGIFVLFDGFGLVTKRVEHVSGSLLRIFSDNPQYSAYERSPEEAHIVGRVVWFAREI